ncbi:MAG TPA: outer membrane beta-barrel protein [Chitinophagaceae bacterium]|nr:outer membrane beta-barrel protein [Chitinophagaceae bacterium]
MLQKFVVAAMGLLSVLSINAQVASVSYDTLGAPATAEEEKKEPFLTITGSVDAYYKYDFGKSKANTYTSFTQTHNSFALGMASVKFEHKGDKVSAVADLGFGPRAKDFAYTDEGITQAIKQLYVSYSATDWLKFTAGTWATHVGYELLDPQLNRNYSMSYMFTNGPFSHTGLKAEVSKGKHGVMLGVANATDFRIPPEDFINKKFVLAQYSFAATDNLKFYLNYVGGQNPDTSKVNQFDAVITAKISDQFNIGYNGTINSTRFWDGSKNIESQSWWGSALYLNYDPRSWFGLSLRGEYFGDKDHLKIAVAPEGCNIFATTLSANFKSGGFTFIPEFRLDNSNKEVFVDKDGAATKSAANFLLAAIYSF